MEHVVILGAGFGGLELASRLSDSAADEARVTLIDQSDGFTFGFWKLDILFRGWWNPWGHAFDAYGQSFITDGAGGDGISWGVPGAMYSASG